MAQLRGGTGQKRGDVYGGKVSTRPASDYTAKNPDANDRSPKGAVSIGALFPKLTKQAFEQFGFSAAQLVAEWPAIAGPELSGCTLPEKLKWPHGTTTFLDDQTEHTRQKPSGATLVLRVDGPRSLEVQFSSSQIMERINRYFGYRAVTDIRIIQAPLPKKEVRKDILAQTDASELIRDLSGIKDPALRDALSRMAKGVKAFGSKRKLNS